MTFEVKLSFQAEKDLRTIYEYIAFELQAVMTASRQLDRLETKILALNTFPTAYPQYQKEPWLSRGLRFLPVDNYLIYFIVDEELKVVTVIRIMYAARDVERALKQTKH